MLEDEARRSEAVTKHATRVLGRVELVIGACQIPPIFVAVTVVAEGAVVTEGAVVAVLAFGSARPHTTSLR
jgi:hypothetical protein